jgi:hypothetical protein
MTMSDMSHGSPGLVPVSDPRIVMVVLINEPDSERTSGGKVAAPIFRSGSGTQPALARRSAG